MPNQHCQIAEKGVDDGISTVAHFCDWWSKIFQTEPKNKISLHRRPIEGKVFGINICLEFLKLFVHSLLTFHSDYVQFT